MKHVNPQLKKCLPGTWTLLIVLILLNACTVKEAPVEGGLSQSTPEAEGVSSASILEFLDAVEETGQELHGFVYLRNGKEIAKGWWEPYAPGLKHTLYSTSKSFTSTAIGFAVTEGLLTVDDKVISFFPDLLPDTVSENLASMTLQNLLTMSAGQDPAPDLRAVGHDQSWVEEFLAFPVPQEPGSVFLYNSHATYMLSAIITKVTGQAVLEYLEPRLFEPLGIEGADWETDPEGINSGGWGLRLKTEDMARFGQLLLQKGKWNGEQVLPEEWIAEATSMHIDQAPGLTDKERVGNDWIQGYGYKFWRSQHNSFRADGAYGQLIMVLPEKNAVIAINAEVGDMQKEMNLVWDHLLPGMKDEALEADPEGLEALKARLAGLSLPVPEPGSNEALQEAINNSICHFENGEEGSLSCSFSFEDGQCHLTLDEGEGRVYELALGAGEWVPGETMIPGPNLVPFYETNAGILLPSKIASAYRWKGDNSLVLTVRYIESPHRVTYTFTFDGDRVSMKKNATMHLFGDPPALEGKLESSSPD